MTALQVTLLVAGLIALDVMIIGMIAAGFRTGTWGPLEKAHPPRSPVTPNERREFQSFAFDLYNVSWSVHVTIDEHCLHLHPAAILRWAGAGPMSIPWDAIELKDPPDRRWGIKAKIGGVTVKGPSWCMRVAAGN